MSSVIGRSLPRIDGAQKVTGVTRFAGDIQLPGMLHARLVLSPHPHARVVRVDRERAAALPGVVAVFTGRDLPLARRDAGDRNAAPLAIDRAVFNGHPVVAVVADSERVAEDAAALVEVAYEELPAVTDPWAARQPDAPVVRQRARPESDEELGMHGADPGASAGDEAPEAPNVASTVHFTRGDVDRGFAEADAVVERTYRTSMLHQGYLEPRASVAALDPVGTLTVWTSTQALFFTRSQVATAVGLPESRVKLVAMPVGGGFGGKFGLTEPLAAALALATRRRPVSLVMSRSEEFLGTTPAPQSFFTLKAGVTRDGRLTALEARVLFDAGAFPGAPLSLACLLLGAHYRCPNLDVRGEEVMTHKPGSGAYRAPGAVQAAFAMESHMDELARAIGMDPLELRIRNVAGAGDPMPNGKPWPPMSARRCLETLRARRWPPAAPRDGRHRRGIGVAIGGWVGGVEPASAVCRLNADGSLTVVVGSVDLSGTSTALTQIAAATFGIEPEAVAVVNADTDSAPQSGASGGSKITYTVGAAVQRAAADARRQALAIAASHLEAAVHDLEIADGAVRVRGVPDRRLALAKIAHMATEFGGRFEPVFGRGASATTERAPGFAAHLAEVEVDAETGNVDVIRQVVVQDVGRALNPAAVEGQVQGAVAQGVGWALLERMEYDSSGRLVSGTLMDYALPKSKQVPGVEVVLLEEPSAAGPFGAKGVGEPPVIAAGAAIANAIADAMGHRFTDLPITPGAICAALAAGNGSRLASSAAGVGHDAA